MKRMACVMMLVWLVVGMTMGQEPYRVLSYNVENLFDTQHDEGKEDTEFLPEGARRWTWRKYRHKQEQIARVICCAGEWTGAMLIGLQEVENDSVLHYLTRRALRQYEYAYVHYESDDVRGIDVALLYDTMRFRVLESEAIRIPLSEGERPTRDILYVRGVTIQGRLGVPADADTLHIFVCHMPSQLGGKGEKQARRERAFAALRERTNAILSTDDSAPIIVMGDMNDSPANLLPPLTNLMLPYAGNRKEGTEKYRTHWNCLDQIYVSPALLPRARAAIYRPDWLLIDDATYGGKRPRRTFPAYSYDPEGYSDHLPVYVDISTMSTR